MWPAALAAGVVVWFAVAGVGLGFLLEPELRPLVRRVLRRLKMADGMRHPDPTDEETETWTRRWSRVLGFLLFFAGAIVIESLPIETRPRRILLAAFGGVVPVLGFLLRWRRSSSRES